MNPQTWEHMEMMINEGHVLEDREQAIEWLESRPLIAPPQNGSHAASSMIRRPMFQLIEDHGEEYVRSLGCIACGQSHQAGHTMYDLDANKIGRPVQRENVFTNMRELVWDWEEWTNE